MFDVSQRYQQDEWMDRSDIAPDLHIHALHGLRRINWLSGSGRIVWDGVCSLSSHIPNRPLRILDLACGSGDVVIDLARRASKHDLAIEVHGTDISQLALEQASRLASNDQLDNVQFYPLDVFQDTLPSDYDIIMCSLFLHHLDREQAIEFLRRIATATRHAILINDLCRTRLGYVMAYLGTRALTRSPVVHFDGPASVAGAWTCGETRELATEAGLQQVHITRRFPERFLLTWMKT
jgi:2-polyprenyl-3-methyl-5-hydroxy-6-metoxy-1,4-benzoquinol methylase